MIYTFKQNVIDTSHEKKQNYLLKQKSLNDCDIFENMQLCT